VGEEEGCNIEIKYLDYFFVSWGCIVYYVCIKCICLHVCIQLFDQQINN